MEKNNSLGIIRKIDGLGRIVLPVEIRRLMKFREGDSIEILVEGEDIIVRKYITTCMFCNKSNDLIEIGHYPICRSCIEKAYNKSI